MRAKSLTENRKPGRDAGFFVAKAAVAGLTR